MGGMLAPLMVSLLALLLGHDEAELVFAGDAMMHQAQIDAARTTGGDYDFTGYFDAIRPYVTTADYAVVNLETPVSAMHRYSGYPCFNAPPAFVDALADAGFDLFLTANNHTLDRSDRGLRATLDCLDARGHDHIGTYRTAAGRDSVHPLVRTLGGIRVGFLNYTYGTNGITARDGAAVDYINRGLIRSDVGRLREAGAEVIAACVHWGEEYKLLPAASQRSLGAFLRDSLGVELVIGSHPHVVQPMELSADSTRLTVYSLGNFISNMRTRDTRGGAMVRVRLERGDDGRVRIADARYRLVFTEPAGAGRNFRLVWPDASGDSRAADFARAARALFDKHNVGVPEHIAR